MLVNLPDYKPEITLIHDSGVQFLDFGLTLPAPHPDSGRFVRQTANGPLLRLDYDVIPGKFTLPGEAGSTPEIVRPESHITLDYSLAVLDNTWLPLPFPRVNASGVFSAGPDNWARFQIHRLKHPDGAGNTLRICLAFDTRLAGDTPAQLAPTQADVRNSTRFALAWRNEDIADFLDLTWVDGWLRETFLHYIGQQESRSESDIASALKGFEYQAHFLNLLELTGTQLLLPYVVLGGATLAAPTIPVSLILDVGNTHTCGILVEDHGRDNDGLRQCSELQIRSLSEPHYVNSPLFPSRLEFSEARFGKPHFSVESGRDDAFTWPSLVRVGDEACRMAMQRTGTEGASGLSSPRRYLWDDAPARQPWRFSQRNGQAGREPLATAFPLMYLMNDAGQPLYPLAMDERLPVFTPCYSRSSLMTHMLCELLAQALAQMNSVASRLAMGHAFAPRRLHQLILTLPSAMPTQVRARFRQRMQDAIALVWKAQGWHPQDDDFPGVPTPGAIPIPDIVMDWDEATCGQLVWLYNETRMNYAGQAARLFQVLARPDRPLLPDEQEGKTLRVASIDIGGGTTDMAITQYALDNGTGSNVKITPQLLFREGFNIAGDDILLDVIQRHILPALEAHIHQAGVNDAPGLLQQLFGEARGQEHRGTLRQQATLQLLIPLGHALLNHWEKSDASGMLSARVRDLLPHAITGNVMEYIGQAVRSVSAHLRPFSILDATLNVDLSTLNTAVLSGQFAITAPLQALCEAIEHYRCDVLLVTGRPGCLPGVKMLLRRRQPVPVGRIVWMQHYALQDAFPFSQQGRIGNPKSTAAMGAMLFHLATTLRLPGFNFHAADITAWSTLRYLGVLDADTHLSAENVWYHDADEDENPQPAAKHFPLRGNVRLGFRQLANPRWPATPLYTLEITDPALARAIAGDGIVYVRLQGDLASDNFSLAGAWLHDGSPVAPDAVNLHMNTLTSNHYWIDSGSVYPK